MFTGKITKKFDFSGISIFRNSQSTAVGIFSGIYFSSIVAGMNTVHSIAVRINGAT
jgi:hypothetical protein